MFIFNTDSNIISVNSKNFTATMLFMLLGIFFAYIYTSFIKKFRGQFVLALIDSCAFSKESAKSLSELGIKNDFLSKLSIKTSFYFTNDYFFFEALEDTNSESPKKGMKYYINEDDVDRLKAKYGNSGITIIQLIITIIAFLAVERRMTWLTKRQKPFGSPHLFLRFLL